MKLSLQLYKCAVLPEQLRLNKVRALLGQEEWTETGPKDCINLHLQGGQEFLNLSEAMGSALEPLEKKVVFRGLMTLDHKRALGLKGLQEKSLCTEYS